MILAHHALVEALPLFIPAVAIVAVVAGSMWLDRRRSTEGEQGEADPE